MRPEMPSIRVSRRGKIAIAVLISLIILVSLLSTFANVYANWLWFGEVHYHRVYRTVFLTRLALFLVIGLLIAVIIGANIVVAYRARPPFRPISPEQESLERYRVALEPHKRLIFSALMALVFLIAGLSGQQKWKIWQLWRNGTSFGTKDPQFHRDISFFAWDYPFYRALISLGFTAVIFALILSVAVHYVFGAVRIVTPGPKLTISARRHITVLVFFFIVLKAIAYWLDRYGLVFSTRGKVTGASYTDVNASLPAKTILFWIAVLIAIAVLASLWLRSAIVAGISFIVLLVLSIAINGLVPLGVQQLTVKPNASDKEAPYISRNIAATRQAYDVVTNDATSSGSGAGTPVGTGGKGVGPVSYNDYATGSEQPASNLPNDEQTINNVRITDPNVVSPTFTNFQQLKNYYGFADKLDIDRYTVDNTTSDYIVGVRELKAASLVGDQTNWINKHTVFTHGYGLVAAKASQDVSSNNSFALGNIPSQSLETDFPNVTTPQVYFGELGVDYSIVGASGKRESDGTNGKISYAGKGGVSLGSLVNRLTFAMKYGETNFILNDAVSAKGAKIIYNRDPRQRVLKIAPFLQVDGDPYPAVVGGRIVWILDGYTTISNYPYSERQSFGQATTDTFTTKNRTAAQPNNQINYIRNSVKATVDAYDGTVNLYQWDDSDPVLKTWEKVFPGIIQPKSAIPAGVAAHIRYPQDLFEVQRTILARYHVSDPVAFYNVRDQWTVPDDPTAAEGTQVDQPPYYLLTTANGQAGTSEFQLTSPMQVNGRPNMAAYISVGSQNDAGYGKFNVLRLPSSSSVLGPGQVFSQFNSDPTISKDLSLLRTGGSTITHGNLLTIPIGGTFLYIEPLYVEGTGTNSFPLLRRVLVAYGENGKPGYADSLSDALLNLTDSQVGRNVDTGATGSSSSPPTTSPPASGSASSSPPSSSASPGATVTPELNTVLSQLDTAFNALQAATKAGNFAAIGQAQADIQRLLTQYEKLRSAPATGTPGASAPTGSARPGATAPAGSTTPKATASPTPTS